MEEEKNNLFLLLPIEMAADILSRLPIDSIVHYKRVCKSWRNLINHPVFVDIYTHIQLQFDHINNINNPSSFGTIAGIILQLRSNTKDGEQKHFLYREYKYEFDRFSVSEAPLINNNNNLGLPHKFFHTSMVGSSNGLVCFGSEGTYIHSGDNIDMCICNPFTREYVSIPKLNIISKTIGWHTYIKSGFGYHPRTKEYKIVTVYYDQGKPPGKVNVYTIGSREWRSLGEIQHLIDIHSKGNLLDGVLFWLMKSPKSGIVSFDLAVEEFRTIPLPPAPGFNYPTTDELEIWGGFLCVNSSVYENIRHGWRTDAWLMNAEDCCWKRYRIPKILGNHMRPDKRTVRKAMTIIKSGKVLLHHHKSRRIVCYDLGTCKHEEIMDIDIPTDWFHYTKSFVSLKALGEKDTTILE